MARLTWQASPRNKFTAYFDEVDKYRGHDMQSNYDPETASYRWFSPACPHDQRQMVVAVHEQMFLEAGWSSNLESPPTATRRASRSRAETAAWFAKASRNDLDLGNLKTAPQSRITESPARYAMMGASPTSWGSTT